jgi:hypothetical protein
MLSRRAIRGPATGFFHTAVRTVRPCQVTSLGKPTFTDSKLPARWSMITSSAPDRRDLLAPVWRHSDHSDYKWTLAGASRGGSARVLHQDGARGLSPRIGSQ